MKFRVVAVPTTNALVLPGPAGPPGPSGGGGGLSPIPANTLLANNTGSTALPTAQDAAAVRAMLDLEFVAGPGIQIDDVGGSGGGGSTAPLTPSFSWSPQQSKSLIPSIGAALTLTRATIGKFLNAAGAWEDAAVNVPRFHHRLINGSVRSVGLLVEPARTNLLIRSGLITTGWTINNLTAAPVTSPDGTANAFTLTESVDGSATFHRIFQSIVVPASTDFTISIFYKPNGRPKFRATNSSAGLTFDAIFDTDSLSVAGLGAGVTGRVEPFPDGWFRCIVSLNSGVGGTVLIQYWTFAEAANYQGSGLLCGTIWAPQCEAGTDASSPIITAATTATRSADSVVLSDFALGASGMLVARTSMGRNVSNVNFLSVNDATGNNVISFGRGASNFASTVVSAGSATFNGTVDKIFGNNQFVTSGVSYSTGNTVAAIDGVLSAVDTSVVLPTNLTQIQIAPNLNGCLASLAFYDTQQPNADFAKLTGDFTAVLPNASAINFSDFAAIDSNSTRVKLIRDLTFINYEYSQPGGRIRFNTTCPEVRLRFTTDPLDGSSMNGIGTLLVNGVELTPVVMPASNGVEMEVVVTGSGNRLIEYVLPYSRAVSFLGLRTLGNGSVTAPAARPTLRYAFAGDSITQGFNSSRSSKSWPYLLANLKSAQVINYGFGSMTSANLVSSNVGTLIAQKNPDLVICCIGYNDFGGQQTLVNFRNNVQTFLNQVRALLPTVKVYLGGPWYTPNTNTITPAMYRTEIQNLVTAAANPNTLFINTLAASTTNTPLGWPDSIHPNDLVSQEIANYLNGVIV
jgi:lysophospholipase L1-like esterase